MNINGVKINWWFCLDFEYKCSDLTKLGQSYKCMGLKQYREKNGKGIEENGRKDEDRKCG